MVVFFKPADVARFKHWIEHQRASAALTPARSPSVLREVAEGLIRWPAFQL